METSVNCDQDESLENLLLSWNLQHMQQYLKDENVTIDVLKIINADQMQELTKLWKIGDKALFCFHFQKWREQNKIPLCVNKNFTKLRQTSSDLVSGESNYNSSELEDNDHTNVFHILKSNSVGCRLLDSFKITKRLTDEQRNLLLNQIARYFIDNNQHMSLQLSYKIEQQILSIFESEKLEFYRTERRGKLYAKFCNLKKNTNKFLNKETEIPSNSKSPKPHLEPEDDAKLIAQSLFYDNLSAEEFEASWSACSKYRLQQILEECGNINEILKIWPQYKKPNGFKLIDKDFCTLHPAHDPILTWGPEKMTKLFKWLSEESRTKSQGVNKVLTDMSMEDANNEPDLFFIKLLWAFHYYVVPTGKFVRKTTDGKKEMARYTVKDSQESFLFMGNSMQELEDHMSFLTKKGESIQPFILAIGNFKKFDQFFIYFDGILLPSSNFIRSLDICFKIFHIFNLQYPKASELVWSFIEKYFYNLNKNGKKNSKVSILLEDLKNI